MRNRNELQDYALLLLRMAGFLLAIKHGWGKVAGLAGGAEGFIGGVERLGFPVPFLFAWAAALSEFGGSLLAAFGLLTRVGAFFAACTVFTAAFVRHKALTAFAAWIGIIDVDPEVLRSNGNAELALMFVIVMVAIVLMGPGRISLDQRFFGRS